MGARVGVGVVVGGGMQGFLTGCDGRTAEREMWTGQSAERSVVSAAFTIGPGSA